MKKNQQGLTLLEMLLVLTILVVIAAITIPVFFGTQRRTILDSQAEQIKSFLRQAQANSQSGEEALAWGMLATNPTGPGSDKIEVYKCSVSCDATGACPGTRTVTDTYTLAAGVNFTTPAEGASLDICFDKRTGKMQGSSNKSVVISGSAGTSRTISISTEGLISLSNP